MSDPNGYLETLGAELIRTGIRGSRRQRIITEFADHLGCEPGADLGDPRALATQFADELGTSVATTAALRAFAALALSGIAVVVRVATFRSLADASGQGLDTVGLIVCVLAAQVAFVAGGLGLVRALLVRGSVTIPREEAAILVRRAGIGLAAGALATLAVPLRAATSHGHTAGSPWLSIVAMGVGLGAIALATAAIVQAARLRPLTSGPARDLLTDLGPLQPLAVRVTGSSITRLALLSAAGLAVVIAGAGVVTNDPYDGILRGVFEGGAFLAGYAVLGRYLGIRCSGPATGAQ